MSWWLCSLDLESTRKYNLAARWLLRQTGVVRQRGEEFNPEDLAFKKAVTLTDPDSGEVLVDEPEDLLFGLNKLLAALEAMNGQSTLDKRGELRTQFYLHLSRKAGERVADYSSRFRTSVSGLKAEGVVLPEGELGWFFKEKLGLDPLRKQLLETALQGSESYAVIESECLRLFRDLHLQDPLFRRLDRAGGGAKMTIRKVFAAAPPPSAASTGSSSATAYRRPSTGSVSGSSMRSSFRNAPPRQAHVAETAEDETVDENDDEAEATEDAADGETTLEEVLQAEVEHLAGEIA